MVLSNKLIATTFVAFLYASSYASPTTKPVSSQYGFIENKGQIVDQNNLLNKEVLFLYSTAGFKVQLKQIGFSYEVIKTESVAKTPNSSDPKFLNEELKDDIHFYSHRVDITFIGGNENVRISSSVRSSDYINYYTAVTPEKGVKNVRHYKKIIYQNIYPNIDVEFLLNPSSKNLKGLEFKYNFIVHPGGKVSDIQLKYNGANITTLTNDGHITIETAYGNIDESIPLSYQLNANNTQQTITAKFKLLSTDNFQQSTIYGISLGNYDVTKTLIIDPLPWATYYGGSLSDYGIGLYVDVYGNLLFAGTSVSTSVVATSGAFQTTYGGGAQDGLIIKFDSRDTLKWATYYGGTLADVCGGIEADSIGNIFVSGYTQSTTGIATSGAFKTVQGGNYDAFLAKFDSTGARIWGTYYGGTGNDLSYYNCIALDKNANIYLVGVTNSTGTQMATSGAFKTSMLTSGDAYDAFLVKFTSSGSRVWSSYYGGPTIDYGFGVALDAFANIYLTGYTVSTTGIASSSGFQITHGGGTNDAYLAKLDSTGTTRIWGTYYGGSGSDVAYTVATDINGAAIIAGGSVSTSSIATSGAFQTSFGGGTNDGFIAKFDSTGARKFGTYYGGSLVDAIMGLTTDLSGNIFFTGNTTSTSGVDTTSAYQTTNSGATDAFIGKLDSTGVSKWGTYFGGTLVDNGLGIVVNSTGNLFVTGQTASTSGIATSGAYQSTYGGPTAGFDAWVGTFQNTGNLSGSNIITGNQTICSGSTPTQITGPTPTGVSGTIYFLWLSSTTGPTSGFSTAIGTFNTLNYSPPSLSVNTWYRRWAFNGLSYSDTSTAILVTVNAKPNSGFTTNNPMQVLLTNSFSFSDTTSSVSIRFWNFGDSTTSISTIPTKSYSSIGIYAVKLIVTNSFGCKDSITKSVTVLPNAPSTSATSLTFSNITNTSMQLTWTNGNGQRRIVIAKAGSAVNSNPQNGISYTSNTIFGSGSQLGTGNFIIYKGPGNTVTISGLNILSQYYFAVVELNGDTTLSSYQASPYLTGNQTTLPVTLIDFTANLKDENSVLLNWSTASELNNDYFVVERSIDGSLFTAFGKIKGNGTTDIVHSYQFIDNISSKEHLLSSIYYRLKQIDFDGKSSLSQIKAVNLFREKNEFVIFPNPSINEIVISTNTSKNTKEILIEIYDLKGSKILNINQPFNSSGQYKIDVSSLDKGMYFMTIDHKTVKFAKQN